jgi:hypothetical protein
VLCGKIDVETRQAVVLLIKIGGISMRRSHASWFQNMTFSFT